MQKHFISQHLFSYLYLPSMWIRLKHLVVQWPPESGAGIINQHVEGKNNTYFAGQIDLELKR